MTSDANSLPGSHYRMNKFLYANQDGVGCCQINYLEKDLHSTVMH